MKLSALIGPIAAATIVNVFLFALMWRGELIEKRSGTPPNWLYVLLIAYAAVPGVYVWFRLNAQAPTGLDVFAIAILAEAMGCVVVYALLHGFLYSRGRPLAERLFPMALGVMLTLGMLAALLPR